MVAKIRMTTKFQLHSGKLSVNTSSVINYDLKEIVSAVSQQHATLSWEVMGKETNGAVFVTYAPGFIDKLTILGSFASVTYAGQPLEASEYLWVVIDQLEAAYRARFMTPESVKNLSKHDFIEPAKITAKLEEEYKQQVAKTNKLTSVNKVLRIAIVIVTALIALVLTLRILGYF